MPKPIVLCLAFFLASTASHAFAQQENKPAPTPEHFFHLSYAVQEVAENGKVINSRIYTTNIGTDGNFVSLKTGDKIPLRTDDKGTVQYLDIGINIDSGKAEEVDGKLALKVNAEVSSNSPVDANTAPVIRQNSWTARVLLPLSKPTVIFSSDNLQDKGRMQVELTATRE
jgi:hypothetical protein